MEKFSLYDFVSFILPGGTFLILFYLILTSNGLLEFKSDLPDTEVIILPFLVLAYLFGHLISFIGKLIENNLPGLKTPWKDFLEGNPEDAVLINSQCKNLFNCDFINNDKIDSNKSDILYEKICDFIEINEKDKKVWILMSQYGFFRNSSALWLILVFIFIILILLKVFAFTTINNSFGTLFTYISISIILFVPSVILLRKRLLLAMSVVYRTFLALNVKPK